MCVLISEPGVIDLNSLSDSEISAMAGKSLNIALHKAFKK